MTTSQYPSIITETNVVETLQEIVRLREDEDVSDFTNLPNRFVSGRGLFQTRVAPSSSSDVLATDVEGDIVNDATHEFKLLELSGTLAWTRILLDTAWAGPGGGWALLATKTASASPSLDFINGVGGVVLDGTFKQYQFRFKNIKTTAAFARMLVRTTTNASTFDSGSTDYKYAFIRNIETGVGASSGSAGASSIFLSDTTHPTSAIWNGVVEIFHPASTENTVFDFFLNIDAASVLSVVKGGGSRASAADVDGVQFLPNTSTIASGDVELWAL